MPHVADAAKAYVDGTCKNVDPLTASGESNVEIDDAKRARIIESIKARETARVETVLSTKDNIGAKASVAVKKHGTTDYK